MRLSYRTLGRKTIGFTTLIAFALGASVNAQTTGSAATIVGTVTDTSSGLALSGASVVLYRGNSLVSTAMTDARGSFQFKDESPAVYHVVIRSNGYAPAQSDDVAIVPGQTLVSINVSVLAAPNGNATTNLRTSGRTTASSTLGSLQRTSAVSRDLQLRNAR